MQKTIPVFEVWVSNLPYFDTTFGNLEKRLLENLGPVNYEKYFRIDKLERDDIEHKAFALVQCDYFTFKILLMLSGTIALNPVSTYYIL